MCGRRRQDAFWKGERPVRHGRPARARAYMIPKSSERVPRKADAGQAWCPYYKPTQVGEMNILRRPENIHLAYLCRFVVRAPCLSSVGFSWHSFRGLRDHICPRPCGTAMSNRPLALPECVLTPSSAHGGAGILTGCPSTTPLGLVLGSD